MFILAEELGLAIPYSQSISLVPQYNASSGIGEFISSKLLLYINVLRWGPEFIPSMLPSYIKDLTSIYEFCLLEALANPSNFSSWHMAAFFIKSNYTFVGRFIFFINWGVRCSCLESSCKTLFGNCKHALGGKFLNGLGNFTLENYFSNEELLLLAP